MECLLKRSWSSTFGEELDDFCGWVSKPASGVSMPCDQQRKAASFFFVTFMEKYVYINVEYSC